VLLLGAVISGASEAAAQPAELTTMNCSPDQEAFLRAAVQDASYELAWVGADLQNLLNGGSSPEFELWFGTLEPESVAYVINKFAEIRRVIDIAQYDCGCNLRQEDIDQKGSTPRNTMAWSGIDDEYLVHLCPPFFNEDPNEFGGGVLIHEYSHFAGSQDYKAACEEFPAAPANTSASVARELAEWDPDKAINNADNYRLYAIGWDPASPTSWTCYDML
jgi:hypothetical protein